MLRAIVPLLASMVCSSCGVPSTVLKDHAFSTSGEKGVVLFSTSANRLCEDYMLLFASEGSGLDQRGVFSAEKSKTTGEVESVYLQAFEVNPKSWGIDGFLPSSRHERHAFENNYFVAVAAGETVYAGGLDLRFREDCRIARVTLVDRAKQDIPLFLEKYPNLDAADIKQRIYTKKSNPLCSKGLFGTSCFP